MIDKGLRDRYSRQIMFSGIGEEGQAKLFDGDVVIIGCGALGSNIATFLVRAGVGKIRIVDRDFIEYHNLQRQILFDEDDIKAHLPKAIAAERHLKKINSTIEIQGIVADANSTNIETLCSDTDVILDGLDNAETRLLINDVSLKYRIPWVYGGAIASSGMTMTIIPNETPCFRCIFPVLPKAVTLPTCETIGILGTAPSIVGSLQATEAIKILVGAKDIGKGLTIIDAWRSSFERLKLEANKNCPACHGEYEFLEKEFAIKTTSFCGQSRSVQVVNSKVKKIDLDELEARLRSYGLVNHNNFMLSLCIDDKEIIVFPDGRAIVKNTIDESLAKELYMKYVGGLS